MSSWAFPNSPLLSYYSAAFPWAEGPYLFSRVPHLAFSPKLCLIFFFFSVFKMVPRVSQASLGTGFVAQDNHNVLSLSLSSASPGVMGVHLHALGNSIHKAQGFMFLPQCLPAEVLSF